jgi:hypothetical protein
MLYTFVITEATLDRITDYLDSHYEDRPPQYIYCLQRSLFGDHIIVGIDCQPATAVMLTLML